MGSVDELFLEKKELHTNKHAKEYVNEPESDPTRPSSDEAEPDQAQNPSTMEMLADYFHIAVPTVA